MRKKDQVTEENVGIHKTAATPEARESQLVALAVNLAEKQLREGTASSQVITHYLKLGSPTEKLQREILKSQKELMEAKTKAYQSSDRIEALYEKAMTAFSEYKGGVESDSDE